MSSTMDLRALPQTALQVLLSFCSVTDALFTTELRKAIRQLILPCFKNLSNPAFDKFKYRSLVSVGWCMKYGVDLRDFTLDLSDDQKVKNIPKAMYSSSSPRKKSMAPPIIPTFHWLCKNRLTAVAAFFADRGRKMKEEMYEPGVAVDVNLMINTYNDEWGWCSPLHYACAKGHMDVVQLLSECGADPNVQDRSGRSPLQMACTENQMDIARYLVLQAGAEVDITNSYGRTPLQYAAMTGRTDIARMLVLECKARVEIRDLQGMTTLHRSCKDGRAELAKMLLLEAKADPEQRDDNDRTPLYSACQAGHFEVVRMILAAGADSNALNDRDGLTALHAACNLGRGAIAEVLALKGRGSNPELTEEETGVDRSSRNKRLHWVRCDVDMRCQERGYTALMMASERGHVGIARMLIGERRADVRLRCANNRTAMSIAKEGDHKDVLLLLKQVEKSGGIIAKSAGKGVRLGCNSAGEKEEEKEEIEPLAGKLAKLTLQMP